MRFYLRGLVWLAAVGTMPIACAAGQTAPQLSGLTTSRVLLLPAQDVSGAVDSRIWLARFDSVVTARLEDGGIGSGWAYPRDAIRHQRQNPSYLTNARALGVQPLAGAAVKEGAALPEPFASRVRAYVALADSRLAIVPVTATIDSAATPREAQLRLVVVDARASSVVATVTVTSPYAGEAAAAADSLALRTARLFVKQAP